ncbi:hypothetical protein [Falsiroseomonas tokyonensis]|uniref:Uncharacterized protein n=1 Tax=Falsiroseomonas tokyonensis TaxID=430521 RepID=A0ABV7C155_9PROT|nr:hypothetical protein [Falsiroseomonas tokyonensis]MBU8540041.1 hypothetical protein [Falsiroseomonas tokyonensis]
MEPTPSQIRRRRLIRTAALTAAVFGLAALAMGLGDVVSAALDPPSPVRPYDPLPRW